MKTLSLVRFPGSITGKLLPQQEKHADSLYERIPYTAGSFNIVVLHGQIASVSGVDQVNLKRLQGENIDYLALGHIHSHSAEKLDSAGYYCYPGCLEGRGFDECGEKGFILLDITNGRLTALARQKSLRIELENGKERGGRKDVKYLFEICAAEISKRPPDFERYYNPAWKKKEPAAVPKKEVKPMTPRTSKIYHKLVRDHKERGSRVLLFVREFKADRITNGAEADTFLGTANYVKHEGSKPMNITWKLDALIPAKYLKKTNKLVVG